MTMPTKPTNRSSDDALEARLAATFDRATQRAAADVAQGDVVLQRPPRPSGLRRLATRPMLVAGFAVLALALSLGVLRLNPTTSTAASSATPVVQPSTSTPPSVSTPPTTVPVNNAVYPVGSGAAERIAASVDRTDFVISGWVLGAEPACPYADQNVWDLCSAMRLHPALGGGPGVDVYRVSGPTPPAVGQGFARQVTVRVHTHDAACTENCLQFAVLDAFVDIGPEQQIPSVSPDGNPMVLESEAVSTAIGAIGGTSPTDYFVVESLRKAAGKAGAGLEVDSTRTVWSITLRKTDFVDLVSEWQVLVDDQTGAVVSATSGSMHNGAPLPAPDAVPPLQIDDVPVLTGEFASSAIGTSDTSQLVGGWVQGIDQRLCSPSATAAQLSWDPCLSLWIHQESSGGLPLQLTIRADGLSGVPQPLEGQSVPVVLRVHGKDLPASDPNVIRIAMVDAVVWTGTPVESLSIGPAPAGVSLATAQRLAKPYMDGQQRTFLSGVRLTLGAYDAIVGGAPSSPTTNKDTWIWLLLYTDGTTSGRGPAAVILTLDGRPMMGTSTIP